MTRDTRAIERAREAWGDAMPAWVAVLATECDRRSQAAVAAMLRINGGYVSYAIRNISPAYHGRVEIAVRSLMMRETVPCPVLARPISLTLCRRHRTDRGEPMGLMTRQLRETCPGCIHNINRKEIDHAAE